MSSAPTMGSEDERSARPGILRSRFWVAVGCWLGWLFSVLGLWGPALAGISPAQNHAHGVMGWYPIETFGGVVSNLAMVATVVWGCTWGVRGVFRSGGGCLPASTWTALTLGPAALLASTSAA